LSVPVVNLIFRHLATFPQALPWCWQALKPLYIDGTIDAQADLLRRALCFPVAAKISRESLINVGLSDIDLQTIRMILRSYERSNAMNLVAFSALLAKLNGHQATEPADISTPAQRTGVQGQMPKPLSLADMSEPTRALALRLASLGGADPIMPTMYRHLAHWPQYLSLIDRILTPLDEQQMFDPAIESVISDGNQRGMRISDGLGQPHVELDPSTRDAVVQTIENFIKGVIAKMIVVVGVIKEGMPAND